MSHFCDPGTFRKARLRASRSAIQVINKPSNRMVCVSPARKLCRAASAARSCESRLAISRRVNVLTARGDPSLSAIRATTVECLGTPARLRAAAPRSAAFSRSLWFPTGTSRFEFASAKSAASWTNSTGQSLIALNMRSSRKRSFCPDYSCVRLTAPPATSEQNGASESGAGFKAAVCKRMSKHLETTLPSVRPARRREIPGTAFTRLI